MNKLSYLILACVVFLIACQREDLITKIEEPPIIDPPTEQIDGSFIVTILDEFGLALEGAEISFSDDIFITDRTGTILIENQKLYKDGTTVNVSHPSYLNGSRKFYPSSDQTEKIKIQLIPNTEVDNFNSELGATVQFGEAKVAFPAGNYLNQNNEPYVGNISVKGKWLDPSIERSFFEMPGNLIGLNKSLQLKSISSQGFIVIKLFGNSGEELKLQENSTALISLPIKLSQSGVQNLALWSYDTANSTWKEENPATLEDGFIVGEINSLEYWNASNSFDKTFLNGTIEYSNALLGLTKLKIYSQDQTFSTFVYSSDQGAYSTFVPQDKNLYIDVFADCQQASHTEAIGSILEEAHAHNLSLENKDYNISISGAAINCQDGNAIAYPLFLLKYQNNSYLFPGNMNGEIDLPFYACETGHFELTLLDPETGLSSETKMIEISTEINLGQIDLCQNNWAGYEFDYEGFNWENLLHTNAIQSWTYSTISGSSKKVIINPEIKDPATNKVYFSGAFTFNEGADKAQYLLRFNQHGFSISGECSLVVNEVNELSSFRFEDATTEVIITDPSLTPDNLESVSFNLVYYN